MPRQKRTPGHQARHTSRQRDMLRRNVRRLAEQQASVERREAAAAARRAALAERRAAAAAAMPPPPPPPPAAPPAIQNTNRFNPNSVRAQRLQRIAALRERAYARTGNAPPPSRADRLAALRQRLVARRQFPPLPDDGAEGRRQIDIIGRRKEAQAAEEAARIRQQATPPESPALYGSESEADLTLQMDPIIFEDQVREEAQALAQGAMIDLGTADGMAVEDDSTFTGGNDGPSAEEIVQEQIKARDNAGRKDQDFEGELSTSGISVVDTSRAHYNQRAAIKLIVGGLILDEDTMDLWHSHLKNLLDELAKMVTQSAGLRTNDGMGQFILKMICGGTRVSILTPIMTLQNAVEYLLTALLENLRKYQQYEGDRAVEGRNTAILTSIHCYSWMFHVQGHMFRIPKSAKIDHYLGGYSQRQADKVYYKILTPTDINCFWVCLKVGRDWREYPALLSSPAKRLAMASDMKRHLRDKDLLKENLVSDGEIAYYADVTNTIINIYNNLYVLKARIVPTLKDRDFWAKTLKTKQVRIPKLKEIHMILEECHSSVLIPKKDLLEEFHKSTGEKYEILSRVLACNDKEFIDSIVGLAREFVMDKYQDRPILLLKDGTYRIESNFDAPIFKFATREEMVQFIDSCKMQFVDFNRVECKKIEKKNKYEGKRITDKPRKMAAYDIESCVDAFTPKGKHVSIMLGIGFFGTAPVFDLSPYSRDTYNFEDARNFDKENYIEFSRSQDVGSSSPVEQFFKYLYLHRVFFNGWTFYGHNAGKFDGIFLVNEYLINDQSLWKIEQMVESNGAVLKLKIRTEDNADIVFLDSVRVAPASLDALGKNLKLKHQKLTGEVDLSKLTLQNWHVFKNDLSRYLKQDCLTLAEAVTTLADALYKEEGLNMTECVTGPSIGIKTFWKNYYDEDKFPIYSLGRIIDSYIRTSYLGGRTEAFSLGIINEPVYYYDVNSMYPDVGRNNLPYGEPVFQEAMEFAVNDEDFGEVLIDGWFGYCRVLVTTTKQDLENELPLFGYKKDLRLVFPIFETETELTLFSEEIHYAVANKLSYKFKFIDGYAFKKAPIMRKFFQTKFDKRLEAKQAGNLAGADMMKLISNSTYGKFGQKSNDKDCVTLHVSNSIAYIQKYYSNSLVSVRHTPCYTLIRSKEDKELGDTNVAIAAAITSYARIKLHMAISLVRQNGEWVHYCDTDSIITSMDIQNVEAVRNVLIPDRNGKSLGSMKNEFADKYASKKDLFADVEDKEGLAEAVAKGAFTSAVIVGAKNYCLEFMFEGKHFSVNAFKGLSKKACSITTGDFVKMVNGEAFVPFKDDLEYELVPETVNCDGFEEVVDLLSHPSGQTCFVAGKRSLMSCFEEDQGVRVLKMKKKFTMNYTKGNYDKSWKTGEWQQVFPVNV